MGLGFHQRMLAWLDPGVARKSLKATAILRPVLSILFLAHSRHTW